MKVCSVGTTYYLPEALLPTTKPENLGPLVVFTCLLADP